MLKALLTLDRSHDRVRIARELRKVASTYTSNQGIDVKASVEHTSSLPVEDLRAAVDVLVVDGHGWCGALKPSTLVSIYAGTIVAPVLVTGWCWAAREDYFDSVARLLAIDRAVIVGSPDKTHFRHANKVYPMVIDAVLEHGTQSSNLLPSLKNSLAQLRYRTHWGAREVTRID